MQTWIRNHPLMSFFSLTYFIAYASLFGYILLNPSQPMAAWTPVWFLNVFSPTIGAVLVAWLSGGMREVKHLLRGFTIWKVGIRWYVAATFLLLGPLVIALIYIALGNPPMGLQPGVTIPILLGTVFVQLFSGPLSEEAGWRGFALPRLEARHTALVSSLILGVLWTFWHLPLFFLTGAAQRGIPFPIYLVLITTLTIYLTWLYNNTHGSLLITTLAHASFNLTGVFITGLVSLMPAMMFYVTVGPLLFLCILLIVIGFGPRNFSRKPVTELPFQREQPQGRLVTVATHDEHPIRNAHRA